jgi:hypothetical protein
MKSRVFLLVLIAVLTEQVSAQNSLNYFYNLSYKNPAYYTKVKIQVDFNSNSYFNKVPSGIYGYGLNISANNQKSIGANARAQTYRIGKNQVQNEFSLSANYFTEINFKHRLTFGLGINQIQQRVDDQLLTTDLDLNGLVYTYGNEMTRNNSLLIPIGIDLSNENMSIGSYYSQGINYTSRFGAYAKFKTFFTTINSYPMENYTGIAISKEYINPQISISDELVIDNYQFDLFGHYNISSAENSLFAIGLGVHYHWKVFDVNFQTAINNQGLGMSHQIGLQLFY